MSGIVARTRTVILRDDDRFLVKVTGYDEKFISFPGGVVREGWNPHSANLVGLGRFIDTSSLVVHELKTLHIPKKKNDRVYHEYTYYLFTTRSNETPRIDPERKLRDEFFWVYPESIPTLIEQTQARYERGFAECLGAFLQHQKTEKRPVKKSGTLTLARQNG